METQRKKKSGRLRRRMRGAFARLGRPVRRRARDHVTEDQQVLVSNEQQPQQPEIELDIVAPDPIPKQEEVFAPSDDRPTKKKRSIFARLLKVRARFRRQKSTSVSDRKKNKTAPKEEVSSPSSAGLFESEQVPLIEVAEPELETSTSFAGATSAILRHRRQPEEVNETVDSVVEKPGHADLHLTSKNVAFDRTVGAEVDDVTRQDGDKKKHHRKRKRAKRYAKRVGIIFR